MTWQNILLLVLTGQVPVAGSLFRWLITERNGHMKLIVDLEKDLEFLKDKFSRLIPEGAEDVAVLGRKLAADAYAGGLTQAAVCDGLKTVVAELEQQLAAA